MVEKSAHARTTRRKSMGDLLRVAAAALLSAVLFTTPTVAEEPAALAAEAQGATDEPSSIEIPRDIPLSEFHSIVDGKTVYFELEDGTPWGREYYIPGTQDSVFVFHDGECFEGYWQVEGLYYCYYYRDQPSCWLTFWEDGQIKVESRGGMRQVVGKIVDFEPLSCQPELLSRARGFEGKAAWPPLGG